MQRHILSRNGLLAVAVLLTGICAPCAYADSFHYRNLLIGDRATGFGGAYAALSDDAAGLHYNPAGTVYSKELASATVNVLSISNVEFEDFFPDGGSLEVTSSGLVPSYFGILRHIGTGTIGFSITVSDFLSDRQSDRGSFDVGTAHVDQFLTGDSDYRHYNIGPSFAQALNQNWSWGVSLFGTYRDEREARSIGGDATKPGAEAGSTDRLYVLTSYRIEDTQIGVRPQLGLQYRNGTFKAGWTVSRDFALSRDYDYFYRSVRNLTTISADGSEELVDYLDASADSKSSEKQAHPWQFSLGLAMDLTPSWTVSVQVDQYLSVDDDIVAGADGASPPVTRQFDAVTNWSIGSEWRLSDRVGLRMALYTDNANLDAEDAGAFERRESVDLLGGALSASYRDDTRTYKLGFYFSSGDGHGTLGDLGELNFGGQSVVDINATNFTLIFGATL